MGPSHGIKDTVLGWLRATPDKQDELEDAEADEMTREYSAERADTIAGFELGGGHGDFESDQEASGIDRLPTLHSDALASATW